MLSTKDLKILIVDDLPENIVALSAVLKQEGYFTLAAKSGAEALAILNQQNIGLVLLDVQMPVMNGFETAAKIQENEHTKNIPIIFLTANADRPELKLKSLKAGGLEYLTKPLDIEMLLLKVNNLLSLSLAQIQLKEANQKLKLLAKDSELSYENLFYSSFDEVFIISEHGIIQKINRPGKLSMGVYASELIGRHIGQLPFNFIITSDMHPDHYATSDTNQTTITGTDPVRFFEVVMKNGVKGQLTEATLLSNNGNPIYYELSGNLIHTTNLDRLLQLNIRDISKRKEAQLLSKKSEESFRKITETTAEMIHVLHPNGTITWVNKAWRENLGYGESEIIGEKITKFILRDSFTKIKNDSLNILSGKSLRIQRTFLTKTGEKLFAEGTAIPVYQNNTIVSIQAFLHDVTARITAENKLTTTNLRLNDAQRIAKIGSWELDLQNNVLTWSDEAYRLFDVDPEKFGATYEAFLNIIHPDDREMVNKAFTNSLKTKLPYKITHRLKYEDGSIRFVEEQCETFYDANGNPVKSIGTTQDITDKILANEKLLESETLAKGILDALTSNIAVVDANGNILITNYAWNKFAIENGGNDLKKTSTGSNYFETCFKAYSAGDQTAGLALQGMKDVLEKRKETFTLEYPCHAPNKQRWFLLSVTNYNPETSKIVVRHVDITERKITEAKLKLDSEILSGINDAVIYSDLDLKIIEWNTNAETLYGWNKSEVVGKRFPEFLGFNFLNGMTLDKMVIQLIRQGKFKSEIQASTKNKQNIYISVNTSILKSSSGNPIGYVSIHRDITERREHEKALELSELNYKELFEQSPYGIITLNLSGNIESVNNKMTELTGYSKYKFIGKHFFKSPFNSNPIGYNSKEIFDLVMRAGRTGLTFEALGKKESGEIIHCEINAKHIQEIENISLIIRDITDLKNSEKFNQAIYNITSFANSSLVTLQNFGAYLQKELSAYFDTRNFCISSYNSFISELEFVYFNDNGRTNEQTPLPRRNAKGLTEYIIKTQKQLLISDENITEFLNANSLEVFGQKPKCWMGVPLIAGSGAVGALAVQSYTNPKEFTEKHLEIFTKVSNIIAPIIEKLKNDQKLLLINSAIESAGDAVFITNPVFENNPIIFANRKFFELSQYNSQEIYKNCSELLFGPNSSKQILQKVNEAFEKNIHFNGEVISYRKDKSTYWSDLTISPVKNQEGKATNFVVIQKDITLKKNMERLLIEKNKELELFMYRASHDLKGPLSTSKGLVNFAIEECHDNNILNYLRLMEKSNEKLENILSDLMEIVIIREGMIEKTPVNLESLIKEIIDQKEVKSYKENDIKLIFDFDVPEYINVDTKLLKIALRNVLNNAVKYSNLTLKTSYINTAAKINNQILTITVADNGIGINEKFLPKVFDMFFRATDSSSGTGLGLYITKNAVDKLNGTISIESTEREGTLVTINIPL